MGDILCGNFLDRDLTGGDDNGNAAIGGREENALVHGHGLAEDGDVNELHVFGAGAA